MLKASVAKAGDSRSKGAVRSLYTGVAIAA